MKRTLTILTVLIAAAAITTSLVSDKTQMNQAGSLGQLSNLILNSSVIHNDDESDDETPAAGNRQDKREYHLRSVGQMGDASATIAAASDDDDKEDNDGEEGNEDEVTGPDRLWGAVKMG